MAWLGVVSVSHSLSLGLCHTCPQCVRRGLPSAFCSAEAVTQTSWQFVLAALVLSLLLPKSSQYVKWIVAAGLAQVSELSFVLGSRARRAGIISREVSLHPRSVCVWGAPVHTLHPGV